MDVEDQHGIKAKWLDVSSLMNSFLPHIQGKVELEEIYFFTAIRDHERKNNHQTVKRHERYLKIIESKGVQIVHGKFKETIRCCKKCGRNYVKYEEKETDVNIAVKLVELAYLNKADVFIIVSGDTDLIPGIDLVNRQFSDKEVYVVFPYGRKNDDFKSRVKGSFKLKKETYLKHQFPNPYEVNGKTFNKPSHW